MNKKTMFGLGILGLLLLITQVNAFRVDYFYSPSCPHCQEVSPMVNKLYDSFNFYKWNFYDTTETTYNVKGVPTIKINTEDCRNVELVGSQEISKYLKCELQQQSTKECKTHLELNRGSYFIE